VKTKLEYLSELEGELKFLNKKDRADYLRYYRQKIDTELDYGIPEEKIIKNLPDPRALAIKIYNEKGIDYIKLQKSKVKTTTIIFTILSSLLILGTFYIGINVLIFLGKMFVNMVTLYGPFFKLPFVDLFLSVLFLTIYLLLVILFTVILLELILMVIRLLLHRLFDIYPKLKDTNLEPYSFFYWINKTFKNDQVIYKAFGVLALLLIGVGVLGFFNKTYIYRVMKNTPLHESTLTLNELDPNNLSIDVSNYEMGLVILPSEDDKISIKYKYEIDHDLKWNFTDNTLYLTTKVPRRYDLFNLLKEPLQYIYIYLPNNATINDVNLKITYGQILIDKTNLDELNIEMLSGDVATQESTINKVLINANKVNYQSKNNIFNELNLEVKSGIYSSTDDVISNYQINNIFTDGKIKNLQSDTITLTNQSGNFTFEELYAQNFNVNTSGGSFVIEKYELEQFKFKGTGIGTLRLVDGKHVLADIEMNDGVVYTTETDGDIVIKGYDLSTNSTNQRSGKLEITQELGNISIINELDTPNKISQLKCVGSDVDIMITSTYIEEMDLNLGKAIVMIEEVYGRVVQIKVNSGDLNYHNENLEHQFESFKATIQLGSKNVNIQNTVE
jgi:uncharacterized membrane protein